MGVFGTDEDLWRFNVEQSSWESLITKGEKPEQRSFHVMTSLDVRPSSPRSARG